MGKKKVNTKTRRSVGAYGSTRGKERQKRRREIREQNGRWQSAMDEVRLERERLEAMMRQERPGSTAGAQYARELVLVQERATKLLEEEPEQKTSESAVARKRIGIRPIYGTDLRYEGDPKPPWEIRDARQMLRHGYHVHHVMATTGVGYKWLDDIPLGTDGYAVEIQEQKAKNGSVR